MQGTYIRSDAREIRMGNANMEIGICRTTGRILELIHLKKNLHWNTNPGRVEVYDGLEDRHFKGGASPSRTIFRVSRGRNPSVVILRRFRGAAFYVKETFRAEKDCIHWNVELGLDRHEPDRSVEIRQLVPYPEAPWGWNVWSANFNFPSHTHNVAGLHLEYGDICFGTVIPAVTVYDSGKDVGIAIAKPFGKVNPRLRFYFTDYHDEGIFVENDLLGLRHDKKVISEIMLRFHEGCFRPTLAWLFKKYPEYFLPGNPEVRKFEGGSMFGPPHVSAKDADKMAKSGIKWYEIHHSMPYYGQYCPEERVWFDGSDPTHKMNYGRPINIKVINDCGRILARRGIASLLYLQVTGDAYLPRWPRKWVSSLARDINGSLFPAIVDGAFANSDPSLPFGKEMQRQVKGILERYPDISGIFLDQACYNATDCAHDDGITMCRNKPAYRLRYNYDRHVPGLVRELHRQGKIIYANGTYDIELGLGFDGNMAESTSKNLATMKYMHIARPLLFFAYCKDEDDIEHMLQNCLLAGASWSYWITTEDGWFFKKDFNTTQREIYKRYLPLCEKLLGRRILLEPNPLRLLKKAGVFSVEDAREVVLGTGESAPVAGEIFLGEKGDILVSLVTLRKRCLDRTKFMEDLQIAVRTKHAGRVARAYVMGADYEGDKPVRIKRIGNELILTLPVHGAASLVVLKTRGNKLIKQDD